MVFSGNAVVHFRSFHANDQRNKARTVADEEPCTATHFRDHRDKPSQLRER
jgi:hypothetical protein